ncbi:MAG: hypothetical protein ACRC68_12195 [Clostridium sp.]
MNIQIEKEILKIRDNVIGTFKMSLNDNFTDYDDIVDIVSEYSLEVSELYKSYDKYVCCIVNEEYEEISEEKLLNINLEIKNRINRKYDVDIEFQELEKYFIGMFDEAMYQIVNNDNPIMLGKVFDMIDQWTEELDIYIKNII